ncbi:MAG TPA: preprotein translocase subunit SecG [Blastocatellia bacterium]|nr:preprotein translocase subunit SecG [Blastocatellia bacterium]
MFYFLLTIYILSCLVLILFVLLQPGKSDASAVFGGGMNSTAFGPRGTQTVLAKVTITAAIVFFLTAFLFSIPGLFEERSVAEGVTPAPVTAPAEPATTPAPAEQTAQPAAPAETGEQKPPQDQSKQENK